MYICVCVYYIHLLGTYWVSCHCMGENDKKGAWQSCSSYTGSFHNERTHTYTQQPTLRTLRCIIFHDRHNSKKEFRARCTRIIMKGNYQAVTKECFKLADKQTCHFHFSGVRLCRQGTGKGQCTALMHSRASPNHICVVPPSLERYILSVARWQYQEDDPSIRKIKGKINSVLCTPGKIKNATMSWRYQVIVRSVWSAGRWSISN